MKKILKNKKVMIGIVVVLVLALIGGASYMLLSGDDGKPKIIKKKDKEPTKKLNIVSLDSKSRPYAVMINNISTARPLQSGLQDAYLMYEIIVEGGITRYLAVFVDTNTERIGSVRSARHYFIDYALENDAFYVHHGQSPQAQADFSKLGVDRIVVDNSKTGWRDKSLKVASEHTLFTSMDKLKNGINKRRVERKKDYLLNYSVDEVDLSKKENSKTANNVKIVYSNSSTTSYTYNESEKVYYRFVNDKEHKDYVTGKQYTFKNIITYQVENYTLNDGENKGRQDIKNVGFGTGYYITDGYAVQINWKKSCRECQTEYTYLDGKEIDVNDGNTFIQIQPKGESLEIS